MSKGLGRSGVVPVVVLKAPGVGEEQAPPLQLLSFGFKNFRGTYFSLPALPEFTPFPTHAQYSLLRPLKVHARLGRECLQHFLLLWGEGGHRAGGRCGCRHGKGSLDLISTGIPYKQLIVDNAQPWRQKSTLDSWTDRR